MARAARGAAKKKGSVKVDFSGVETQTVIPEGEYVAEVAAVKVDESSGGNEYLAWEMIIADGKYANKKIYNNTSLQEQSLWATKKWLENLGVEVEDGAMELELDDYVGMQIGIVVEHEVYKGRTRSRVVDTFPAEGEGDEKGEEKASGGEDPTWTAEEIGAMGKSELKEVAEEAELDLEFEGSTSACRRLLIKALDKAGKLGGAEEKEEKSTRRSKVKDEEEEEKAPAGKGKGKAKKVTYSSADVNAMDAEALEELVEKHELTVDLEEHSTTRRKRSAVIDALEEAELLAD